jgi:hypothetical protein
MSMLSYCVQAANLAKQHTHNSHPHAHTHTQRTQLHDPSQFNLLLPTLHNLKQPCIQPLPFLPSLTTLSLSSPFPPSLTTLSHHPLSFLFSRQYFSTAREESNSHWQKTMICTIILFPVIVVLVTSALNCVAGKN